MIYWQPIASAPKDTRVLVFATLKGSSLGGHDRGKDYGKHVVLAQYDTYYGFWVDGSQCEIIPSHWMALPDAPKDSK